MNEGIIKGSIGDLIFRIETLSSDRDTIKVCVRAAAENAAKDDALAAAQHTVTVYALAARAIALWTDKYCDKDLPYDEMIAQAVRDMAKDLEAKDEALEAARGLIAYRDRVGPLNFQLEKADDFINGIRNALSTPATTAGAGATP